MLMACLAAAGPGVAAQETEPPLETLGIEQLLDVPVVSASRARETVAEAPATVIVVSHEEIVARGYGELSELLDDLPGMDVVRPWGATYVKSYWRGYRNTIGDPFLLMVDGLILNHLYFNTADVIATLPLAAIERVEVVYGPASVMYGANAVMGVIHVITRAASLPGGATSEVWLSAGSHAGREADLFAAYRRDDLRVSVAARADDGELDPAAAQRYEYTRDRYYADRALWGGFLDNPNLGGRFESPHRNRALDLRLGLGGAELGLQYQRLDSGYGLEYAGDRAQNLAVWARPQVSAHLRLEQRLGDRLGSSTLLRWRSSDVASDSTFLESLPGADAEGRPAQLVDFSYWQSLNSSWSLFQDFDLDVSPRLSLNAGFKYERKVLQKAYDIHSGPSLPAAEVDAARYPYPLPPVEAPQAQNQVRTDDEGAYLLGRVRLGERHRLNLGLRHDHNSQYGASNNVRAGYVGRFGRWGAKALFGQAFQEPVPRLLYGGWTGSGSDPDLRPERSRTLELSGSLRFERSSHLLSLWAIENHDTIGNTAQGAMNLGERDVVGLDYQAQLRLPVGLRQPLRAWVYYSRYLRLREHPAEAEASAGSTRIPDLADDKLWLGLTAPLERRVSLSLRGRFVGPRPTVATNPVREAGAFATVDLALVGSDLFVPGLGATLRITNLLGTAYAEPGVRDAEAGVEPGAFDSAGAWHGSGGFFSSLLPQPGRQLFFLLRLER